MNLIKFIENRYQELNLENEGHKDAFNVRIDSEMKAAHQILSSYRWIMKWVMMPKVMIDFMLVKFKLQKEPEPVMLNRMKQQKEEEMILKATVAQMVPQPENNVSQIKH